MATKKNAGRRSEALLEELIKRTSDQTQTEEHILNALKKLTRMFELGVKIASGMVQMSEVENALNRINGRYRQAEQESQTPQEQESE